MSNGSCFRRPGSLSDSTTQSGPRITDYRCGRIGNLYRMVGGPGSQSRACESSGAGVAFLQMIQLLQFAYGGGSMRRTKRSHIRGKRVGGEEKDDEIDLALAKGGRGGAGLGHAVHHAGVGDLGTSSRRRPGRSWRGCWPRIATAVAMVMMRRTSAVRVCGFWSNRIAKSISLRWQPNWA